MKHLEEITFKMQEASEEASPMDRLAQVLRISLSFYPTLKESFFSDDLLVKKESLAAIRFLLEKVDEEIFLAAKREGISPDMALNRISMSEKVSAEDCQKFMQARALVMEHADEIFAKAPVKRSRPPNKLLI